MILHDVKSIAKLPGHFVSTNQRKEFPSSQQALFEKGSALATKAALQSIEYNREAEVSACPLRSAATLSCADICPQMAAIRRFYRDEDEAGKHLWYTFALDADIALHEYDESVTLGEEDGAESSETAEAIEKAGPYESVEATEEAELGEDAAAIAPAELDESVKASEDAEGEEYQDFRYVTLHAAEQSCLTAAVALTGNLRSAMLYHSVPRRESLGNMLSSP